MFRNAKAFSSFSVDNLGKAKDFYEKKLGLKVTESPEGLELEINGDTQVFIYESTDYNPPEHTILNFIVDDIDATISELDKRGIKMEHYDMPDIKTDAKGIFRGPPGPRAIAWFKDPAQHILSVIVE